MKPWFRVRDVIEELEAHLVSAHAGSPSADGKAERKRYASGEERLKVRGRQLAVPDGARALIFIEGRLAAEALVEKGRFSIDLASPEAVAPRVADGEVLEVRVGNEVLLRGRFHPE